MFSNSRHFLPQIALFALFTYPLRKHNSKSVNRDIGRKIASTLRHSAASVLLNTTGTVVTGYVGCILFLKWGIPAYVHKSIADVGLSVLLFSVVVSYDKWKKIISFSLSSSCKHSGCSKSKYTSSSAENTVI